MTGLSFIALFVVITVSLYPFIMSEAQRLGPSATDTLNNPFGGAYESPPQIVMTYNNTEHRCIGFLQLQDIRDTWRDSHL